MFEFHHSPPDSDPRGVSVVNSDTVYRLASVTKLFTVLGILRIETISLEDSITKYLPELRDMNEQAETQDAINTVDWDSITVGALAAHQSGIGADRKPETPRNWRDINYLTMTSGSRSCKPARRLDLKGFPAS
jgi:CubicO group peptidase (beta-lactamase class C family)